MELELLVATIVKQWCEEVAQRVQHRWGVHNSIPGNAEVSTDTKVIGKVILGTITGRGQKAFICEFGKGSLMELQDNPYLQDYISSTEFNQWRLHSSRMPTMGRSAGAYKDLDGVTHESSGAMAGLDLERSIGQYDEFFAPVEPMHVIEEEIQASYDDLVIRVSSAVDNYVGRFLSMELKIYI